MSEATYRAVLRNCAVTPRKARYVVDLIRGKPVNRALDLLNYCPRRAAPMLAKLVMSALASAQQDPECDFNRLHVVDVRSDSGQIQRRWTPRSRGQMYPLLMRYSNLTVVLGERDPQEKRERGGVDRSRRARVAASRAAQPGPAPVEAAVEAPAETDDGNTTEEEA